MLTHVLFDAWDHHTRDGKILRETLPDGGARHVRRRGVHQKNRRDRGRFLAGDRREISVPGSGRRLQVDALPRTGVGVTRLGTSEATALGAYAQALAHLDR